MLQNAVEYETKPNEMANLINNTGGNNCVKKSLFNVPDILNQDGDWIKSYYIDGVQHHTRSGILWASILMRTSKKEFICSQGPTYEECINDFNSYNDFTNWCHTQYGYEKIDSNGKFWSIDKDLILPNNKIYSNETCIFVPNKINQLLKSSGRKFGMVGVKKMKYSYQSTIYIDDKIS